MPARTPASAIYTLFTLVVWAVAMPAILIADAGGAVLPWRGPLQGIGAVVLLAAGLRLIDAGARTLAASGVGLFGVGPGRRLVGTGIYGRIRNPIDVGTLLVALAPWVALAVDLMWVVPAGGVVYFVGGVGPYEDRRLLEAFGDEFREYRSSVSKWLPGR